MPLILAASIICAMFACEYTCVFGLNEPFWLKEDKRVDWELVLSLIHSTYYKIYTKIRTDTYKHTYIMYVDSFNSLEQFVMHSTSDGPGFWNHVFGTRNQCEKWVFLHFWPIFFLLIFQSVARWRQYCITHSHFQHPTIRNPVHH